MKLKILLCSLILNTAMLINTATISAQPAEPLNHLPLVQQVRVDLVTKGVIPAGIVNLDNANPCGVFEITRRVVWALRQEGAGYFSKPGGNRCEFQGVGYSMDIVAFQNGRIVDIAAGGPGTDAAPVWNVLAYTAGDESRWRAPVDPGGVVAPPAPFPVPDPVPTPDPSPIVVPPAPEPPPVVIPDPPPPVVVPDPPPPPAPHKKLSFWEYIVAGLVSLLYIFGHTAQ